MNLVIPPLFFYVMGAILTIGGAARAATLGRRRASREITADTPERARERRRHLTWGLVYVVTGLFLIASTAGVLRLRR